MSEIFLKFMAFATTYGFMILVFLIEAYYLYSVIVDFRKWRRKAKEEDKLMDLRLERLKAKLRK
jgi:uncharacterized membrane protein